MKALTGSQTEKNILAAFAGESQARNRYTFFSSKAKNEGFVQIADIFAETADQEKEHGKRLFKFLEGGDLELVATFPAGVIADTRSNLTAAAAGERHEYSELYPAFAETALKEGYSEIAAVLRAVAAAEQWHEKRFLDFARNIAEDMVFRRESKDVIWRCRNCGYVHPGGAAPAKCPACDHPQAHFELLGVNW